MTSFVGRRGELREVRERLAGSRLVTLTGAGGVGKTRLALEVAAGARRAFPHGVWLVRLSTLGIGDSTLNDRVPDAVLAALGIVDSSTRPAIDTLMRELADRAALLVLDNCEHLLEPCARLVTTVLAGTTGVRILATSRATLGVDGEHLVNLAPLSVPAPGVPLPAGDLIRYDATTLLLERARAIQPAFAITERNQADAVALCARLDGIPLAIELAAARLRSLTLGQLVDRLGQRFALLTGGHRGAEARQQTLRALVDWSYWLCSADERTLWGRLSVFAGGFDLEAAEGVCASRDLPVAAILDLLDGLVAQSIVLAEPAADRVRFRLLETIREYGRDRLAAAGDEERMRRRHRDFYLEQARRIAAGWCSPRQREGLATLRADHANFRAALDDTLADPSAAAARLEFVTALRHHWYADGFLGEGRRLTDQALSGTAPPDPAHADVPAGVLADALWLSAWICLLQGEHAVARRRLADCLDIAADPVTRGFATMLLGTDALFAGQLATALTRFRDATAVFTEAGNDEGALWTMFQHAITLGHRGEFEAATRICDAALERGARCGEQLCRSYTLWALGFVTWRAGDDDAALRHARAGLAIQRGFNDPVGAALMIELLAWVHAGRGDRARAADLLAAADAVWRGIGTAIGAFGPPLLDHHARCQRAAAGAGTERPWRGVTDAIAFALALALAEPSRPAGSPAGGPGGGPAGGTPLSHRESEVAERVADGLTNRAIAAALMISPRTVDGHVERILAKLGFTTRAQIAAWAAMRASRTGGRAGGPNG